MAEDQTIKVVVEEKETVIISEATADVGEEKPSKREKGFFDPELIRRYPRSNRKVNLKICQYGLHQDGYVVPPDSGDKGHTVHISPHGLEFHINKEFPEGTLLKINVTIPDYWNRKQRFVDYGRIDSPNHFPILAKVVKSEEVGKRGKKKLVTAQTVNMDEVDEQVLKTFLQEG